MFMKMNSYPAAGAGPCEDREFTLTNAGGMTVTISECGAALRSWRAPDRYGRMADVLQCAPTGAAPACWQGSLAGGEVSLRRTVAGGVHWQASYRLDDDGSLTISHHATAAAAAAGPFHVKSHPCFNLNGGNADVGDHMLQIDADYYVEVDGGGAPVGVAAVGGTPFDFRQPAAIGPRLGWPDTQIRLVGGFDHSYFVRSHMAGGQGTLREVARVFDPGSGRRLQVYTTEAALQLCTGAQGRGFCLEANARPEMISAAWPQVILHPGQEYRQTTVYRLSLQNQAA
jgi:aldose 1-epimerase